MLKTVFKDFLVVTLGAISWTSASVPYTSLQTHLATLALQRIYTYEHKVNICHYNIILSSNHQSVIYKYQPTQVGFMH